MLRIYLKSKTNKNLKVLLGQITGIIIIIVIIIIIIIIIIILLLLLLFLLLLLLLYHFISTMNSLCFFVVCVFFPIQQWPCHNNIVTDGGLNLFDDCAAECVGRRVFLSSWRHSKCLKLYSDIFLDAYFYQ